MEKSGLELDFLNMDKSSHTPTFDRKRSFRDMQGLISKINPEVLKSVIANGCVLDSKKSSLCVPTETQRNVPSVPVCDPALRLSNWCGENGETAPMTIFYNGEVTVFDVSSHKAQDILKLAEKGGLPKSAESSESKQTGQYLLHALSGDLPIARRKSLHSFLEKRKESLSNKINAFGHLQRSTKKHHFGAKIELQRGRYFFNQNTHVPCAKFDAEADNGIPIFVVPQKRACEKRLAEEEFPGRL